MAGRRDRQWIEGVLARWERPLVAYARRITRDRETAREVVQETFLRLLQQERGSLDDRLAPWLFTVCRRLALDVWREEQKTMKGKGAVLDPPAGSLEPEWVAERGEAKEGLVTAIGSLPGRQQEVLRLRFDAGLSYREIAGVTGLSVSNVGYLLHVALRRLREDMTNNKNEGSGEDDRAAGTPSREVGR